MLRPCPYIIRNSKDLLGLLVEEQVVITKIRLLHLSVEILRLQTEVPCVATRANGVDIKQ